MTSTAVDAALAMVFVSAAVGVVATAGPVVENDDPAPGAREAQATLETLAATTTTINYTLAPGARHATSPRTGESTTLTVEFPTDAGPGFQRTHHGTVVQLLGRAAVSGRTVAGTRLTHAGDDFRTRVAEAVRARLDGSTQVVAVWRPYPGAHLSGRLVVGQSPPPDATVNAARLRVPSGYPAPTPAGPSGTPESDGFDALAAGVARALVNGTFPPDRTRLALYGDYPVASLVAHRYLRFGRHFGPDVTNRVAAHVADRNASGANRVLVQAVQPRVAADLRSAYESPAQARRGLRLDRVTVVVRRWST